MDSDEKKLCGGAGGGPEPHDDERFVNGSFQRAAHQIFMLSTPGEDGSSKIAVVAAGAGAYAKVQAEKEVIVRTGGAYTGDSPIPDDVGLSGVTIYAPEAGVVQLQRGNFDEPDSQSIVMKPDGTIFISGGINGHIVLDVGPAGSSFIDISPTGITIKGPLVQIN